MGGCFHKTPQERTDTADQPPSRRRRLNYITYSKIMYFLRRRRGVGMQDTCEGYILYYDAFYTFTPANWLYLGRFSFVFFAFLILVIIIVILYTYYRYAYDTHCYNKIMYRRKSTTMLWWTHSIGRRHGRRVYANTICSSCKIQL